MKTLCNEKKECYGNANALYRLVTIYYYNMRLALC